MCPLARRRAIRTLIAAKTGPPPTLSPSHPGGASQWAIIEAPLAEIMALKHGPSNCRGIAHEFWNILAGSRRLAWRPKSWDLISAKDYPILAHLPGGAGKGVEMDQN